jgi:hypothetical protein
MDAEEARDLGAALARWNIAGIVAPQDPADPDGEWRVYDGPNPETRRDITADALAALADLEAPGFPSPGRTRTGPTRGFVIPSGS